LDSIDPVKTGDLDFSKNASEHRESLSKSSLSFEPIERSVDAHIRESTLSKQFDIVSYLGALYCIGQLILIGFGCYSVDEDHTRIIPFNISILVFNAFSFWTILTIVVCDNIKLKKPRFYQIKYLGVCTHSSIVYRVILFLVISSMVYFALTHWEMSFLKNLEEGIYIRLTQITSILIPAFHFLFYFFVASCKAIFKGNKLQNKLKEFDAEFDKVKQDITEFQKTNAIVQSSLQPSNSSDEGSIQVSTTHP